MQSQGYRISVWDDRLRSQIRHYQKMPVLVNRNTLVFSSMWMFAEGSVADIIPPLSANDTEHDWNDTDVKACVLYWMMVFGDIWPHLGATMCELALQHFGSEWCDDPVSHAPCTKKNYTLKLLIDGSILPMLTTPQRNSRHRLIRCSKPAPQNCVLR